LCRTHGKCEANQHVIRGAVVELDSPVVGLVDAIVN